jgi:hypothetical protein
LGYILGDFFSQAHLVTLTLTHFTAGLESIETKCPVYPGSSSKQRIKRKEFVQYFCSKTQPFIAPVVFKKYSKPFLLFRVLGDHPFYILFYFLQ